MAEQNDELPEVLDEAAMDARTRRWQALDKRDEKLDLKLPELANATLDWIRRRGWVEDEALDDAYAPMRSGKVTGSVLPRLRETGLFDKEQLQELEEVERLTETIPHFQLEKRLGAGAVGAVYLAEHRENGIRVALKFLHQHIDGIDEHRERFEREAAALATLNHPVIPRLIDHSKGKELGDLWQGRIYEQPPYLAMEYFEGITLKDLIRDAGAVPEQYALWAMAQAARALHHAAETANIIHRDLKPENIIIQMPKDVPVSRLYQQNFPLKIIDFGLAKVSQATAEDSGQHRNTALSAQDHGVGGSDLTMVGAVLGTPRYMSPEQVMGENLDWRSDLYSLGCTLFHLLTGEAPFHGNSPAEVMTRHVKDPAPDPRTILPTLGDRASRLVMRCMEKKPNARFASYLDFAEGCERAVQTITSRTEKQSASDTRSTASIKRHTAAHQAVGTEGFKPSASDGHEILGSSALEPKGPHKQNGSQVATTTVATQRLARSMQEKVRSDSDSHRSAKTSSFEVPSLERQVVEQASRTDRILRRQAEGKAAVTGPWIILGACILMCLIALALRFLS